MAGTIGLEPILYATKKRCITIMLRSIASKWWSQKELNFLLAFIPEPRAWWRMAGSNRRPPACKAGALPSELIPQKWSPLSDSNQPPADYKSAALPNELKGRYLFTLQIGQKSLLSNSNLHSGHLFIMQILICVYWLCFPKRPYVEVYASLVQH